MWKSIISYLAGVPTALLDFLKQFNDPEGPMEVFRYSTSSHNTRLRMCVVFCCSSGYDLRTYVSVYALEGRAEELLIRPQTTVRSHDLFLHRSAVPHLRLHFRARRYSDEGPYRVSLLLPLQDPFCSLN
jgi:hypothetical protein